MAEFLQKQMTLHQRIANAYENLKKLGAAQITPQAVESRINALRRNWEKFEVIHDLLCKESSEELSKNDYFATDLFGQVEELFLRQEALFLEHLERIRPSTSGLAGTSLDTRNVEVRPRAVLSRINIPVFDGRPDDWPEFRDLFTSLVIKESTLSAAERFHYLKSSVAGEANMVIRSLPLSEVNFERAWRLLNKYYENPRLLVNKHLSNLFKLDPVTRESAIDLKKLFFSVCDAVEALAALKRPVDSTSDWLVYLVTERLDRQSRREWESLLGGSTAPPSFECLRSFLETRIHTVEALEPLNEAAKPRAASSTSIKSAKVHQVGRSNFTKDLCSVCNGRHFLLFCDRYKLLTPSEREKIVNSSSRCTNCLGRHSVDQCQSKQRCRKCTEKHHTTLHTDVPAVQGGGFKTAMTFMAYPLPGDGRTPELPVLLGTALIRAKSADGQLRLARALIDPGSEVSLITERLAQQLRLARSKATVPVIGVGGRRSCSTRGRVQFQFTSHFDSDYEHSLSALVLPQLTAYRSGTKAREDGWAHLKSLQLADPSYYTGGVIDVLLGADVYPSIILEGLIKGEIGEPVALNSTIGWIVLGPTSMSPQRGPVARSYQCSIDRELDELVTRLWVQEELGADLPRPLTPAEQSCEQHFFDTHQRLPSGRYMVRLPFKTDTPPLTLSSTRFGALNFLRSMERRFRTDLVLKEAYHSFMSEYLQLTHMSKVESFALSRSSCYLPHHGVLKASSSTTKLRVVFNGSFSSASGDSLNDHLHVGPSLLPELRDILLRWRLHRFCLTADIEKMFRQIIIHPADRQFQRILWRTTEDCDPQDYELSTVTYGLACSPFLAVRTLKQLAEDESTRFPVAAAILKRDVYMDDVLTGCDSPEEAAALKNELQDLCTAGGFHLRKWASNAPSLVPELLERHASWQGEELHPTLGVYWSVSRDCFQVRVRLEETPVITRRTVLSAVARIFDPLGLLSPVTISAKIFIQSLWLLKIDWDTSLPTKEANEWCNLQAAFPALNSLHIPRWIGMRRSGQLREIHGFADASERAYAAAVYLRCRNLDGEASVRLVTSKTKVAPLKRVSLPRLELCAATLLSRLACHVKRALDLEEVDIHLWSDSRVTLDWIKGHPSRWNTYVANRVAEIQRGLPAARWHHVPSRDNPADCASRGLSPTALAEFDLWWLGPSWLTEEEPWKNIEVDVPADETTVEASVESRVVVNLVSGAQNPPDNHFLLSRYSNLMRLLRITAWCCRWLRSSTPSATTPGMPPRPNEAGEPILVQAAELEAARARWIKLIQAEHFQGEITLLLKGQSVPRSSELSKLTPFLDDHGILRIGGRLRNSELTYSDKHPCILPAKCQFTKLLVDEAHLQTLHGGVQITLATLRRRYWIIQGRRAVKACLHRCVTCIRWRASTGQQLMGELPSVRVTQARPFLRVGIDYAGPFSILASRGRGQRAYKGYLCVFVCLAVRAVHLELVSDYTAEAFIAALRRFTARRGLCSTIYSDQGTNFVGAARELQQISQIVAGQDNRVRRFLAGEGIHWQFNPPAAPHFGGLWEAAVKSCKHHLRRIVGDQRLTYEELCTLLHQVEACLNSRPLQALSDDPEDVTALTPGHFLIGDALNAVPSASLEETPRSRLSRWQLLQQMRDHFWRRWSSEYLQSLQARNKWLKTSPNPSVGDLCIIKNELLPPNKWPLARIIRLHIGKDGLTRVVTLKTPTSELGLAALELA